MSQSVAIFVCDTPDNRTKAVDFLKAHGYTNITVDKADTITYDRGPKFYSPPNMFETTTGHVVIGVK
jgi:hypothetical protein